MKYMALGMMLQAAWRYIWLFARPTLGWFFIGLGLLGLLLPMLQGILLLVIGTILVGRRNWLIRWSRVHLKLLLRRWATVRTPIIGHTGRWTLRAQQQVSRQQRRLHWRLEAWMKA